MKTGKSVYSLLVAKECLLFVGGKRVFDIYGWQKSVSFIGRKRSFHHGGEFEFFVLGGKNSVGKISRVNGVAVLTTTVCPLDNSIRGHSEKNPVFGADILRATECF